MEGSVKILLLLSCEAGFSYVGENKVKATIRGINVSDYVVGITNACHQDPEIPPLKSDGQFIYCVGAESFNLEDLAEVFRSLFAIEVQTHDGPQDVYETREAIRDKARQDYEKHLSSVSGKIQEQAEKRIIDFDGDIPPTLGFD